MEKYYIVEGFMVHMEVLLDTNFIVSCAKRRIDFLSELEGLGFKVIVPREVLQELKDIRLDVNREDRTAIDVSLKLLEGYKNLKKVGFGSGKVDEEIIKYGKKGIYIASLDGYIKRNVPNRVLIHNASNSLIIERD